MTHAEYLDPTRAEKLCTPAELEIVGYRNQTPPMSWSQIVRVTGKSKSTVRSAWANANRKVRGGYVPPVDHAHDRATEINDPDILKTLQGIPVAGTRGAITGTRPGQPDRSGK